MPTEPPSGRDGRDGLTQRTTYTHDGAGRVTAARDRPGVVTWTIDDAGGRVIDRGPNPTGPTGPPEAPPDEPHIVG